MNDTTVSGPSVGRILRSWRVRNQITQAELADKFEISWLTIYRWEHDLQLPHVGPKVLYYALKGLELDLKEQEQAALQQRVRPASGS